MWQASDLAGPVLQAWLMKFGESMGEALDAEAHARALEGASGPLAVLDAHLTGRDFVCEGFSIADIAIAESIGICEDGGNALGSLGGISQWFARIGAREHFVATRPGA